MLSVATTGIVVSILHGTKGMLAQYGLGGELVRIGAIGGIFAISL